jgi:hypothetical protein
MNDDCLNIVQCANVRPLGNAQSHITPEPGTTPRTQSAQTSLKALAGAVLERTTPRTLPAQCEKTPRTLPAHSDPAPHITNEDELARLVRLCGEAYGFTPDEHSEALAAALADYDAALTCSQTIAAELGIEP